MGDSRERSRGPPSGHHHHRSSSTTSGGGSKKQQQQQQQQGGPHVSKAHASPAANKAVSPGPRSVGGEGRRKHRGSAAHANNTSNNQQPTTNHPQLAPSIFSKPSSHQAAPPTQAVPAAAVAAQQARIIRQQPSALSANFMSSHASPANSNMPVLAKTGWPPSQFFAGQQHLLQQQQTQQQLTAFDINAAFQRSVVVVPGLPRLAHAVARVVASRGPPPPPPPAAAAAAAAANVAAAAPHASRAPTFTQPAARGPRFIPPSRPLSAVSLGGVSGGCGTPLQQFLMQDRPLLRASGSSLDGSVSSSCRDTPAAYYPPPPVFKQAATHAESIDITSSLLRSTSNLSRSSDIKSNKDTVESVVVPRACCGYPLHAMDVSQLFRGGLSCQLRPLAPPPPPFREVDCRSSIQLLEDAEAEASALVVSAQEKARALRAKAKEEIDEEERRLRAAMETSLESIKQKYKNECEQQKELQRREEAQVNVILAKDKKANLQGVVAMVIDFVLKVDVECPIEAIKRFGRADQLLSFKEKSLVQHFPSGELLLKTEDYMVWDEEGRACLQRDAQRQRSSFGSFWTKHQSKVHASDRPAVLLKPPSFVDPLDNDINRRMPSLWEPQNSFEYQPFKLPAFAASSSPSEASPRECLPQETPPPIQVVLKTGSNGMQPPTDSGTSK
ncbi:hypothetical protein Emed_004695 [Eimeria media]